MGGGYFQDKEPREFKRRVFAAILFVAAAFFILVARFWYLQIMESSYYRDLSKNNRIRTVKSPAPRGLIYDRNGVKLAENRPGFDLYLVPEDVAEWTGAKNMLMGLAGIDSETVDKKLLRAKGRPPFRAVKLKEDLTWEETVKIESYKFEMPGVILDAAPKRDYLYHGATAHLIGYLGELNVQELKELRPRGYDPGDLIGKYGVEKNFEEYIRGVDGIKELEVDALGRKMDVVGWTPPYPGNDVTLTIDLKTQITAWEALSDRAGAAVAMEPGTGRLLALVSTPTFDPGRLSTGISEDDWKRLLNNPFKVLANRAIQGQYPPASTFKPITAAAALEEKTIRPYTLIYSGPSFSFAGREYRDWKEEGHGKINYLRAIIESSDTFFYQVGLKLGVDTLAKHSRGMGFGSVTGVNLTGEKDGLVPTSGWKKRALGERWYDGETISVAVGQGYTLCTPLQLVSAYSAIANGGTLYVPKIVEEIKSPSGEVLKRFSPEIRGGTGISGETLKRIRNALKGVVNDKKGTAHYLKRRGLKIAGKTGTAQVAKMGERIKDIEKVPYKYRDHAWFVGFAPYDNPQIAVAVIVEHGGFGAVAAAPVAAKIISAYLKGRLPAGKRKNPRAGAASDTPAAKVQGAAWVEGSR